MNWQGALAGMVVGSLTVLVWIYAPIEIDGKGLSAFMYEIVPGAVAAAIAIVVVSKLTAEPESDVVDTFEEVEKIHQ
jgi:Na+/proline symporter